VISTRALARPTVAAATLASLAVFALAGCSEPATDANERPASSTTTPAEPTTTATEEATPTEPVETTTSVAPEPSEEPTKDEGGSGTPLLGAADVPGFNDEFRWKEGTTSSKEPRALFGTCQRFALTSIGATAVAHRTFLPAGPGPGTDQAAELVAEFPDSTTARRAFAVLKSWRANCADRLKSREDVQVGALQDVGVDGGTAGWYLVNYGPVPDDQDAQYFDAQGMAVVGSRIAMVEMILAGQDYNYEPGQEPMVTALQRAAARLT
jgi:hypothetical protein